MLKDKILETISKQYEYFDTGETIDYDFRIKQLKKTETSNTG